MKRAILLVDHGSRRDEANATLEGVANLLRERLPDELVQTAHMELADPDIAQGVEACVAAGAREIVVVPYFLARGNHATGDVPELVRKALARHPDVLLRVAEPLGVHPALADVLLDRIRTAAD